ncbi:MAG: tol-pal system YbgF family protein [Candidatus Scalindua sp.]
MSKYKQIVLLVIFGMVSLCALNDVLSVEKNFGINDVKKDEIEVMLETLERERAKLDKLRLEFKGTSRVRKDVEKEKKVILTDFVKKSVEEKEKPEDIQNSFPIYKEDGEVKEIITLENEGEDMGESEKVGVNNIDELIHPFEIAENLYKLGEYETALDIYKLIIKNNNTKDKKMWISYQIANCYRKLSLYNKAVEAYREMQELYEGTYWAKQAQWYIQDIKWRAKTEGRLEKIIER